jgi:hypothetical protein
MSLGLRNFGARITIESQVAGFAEDAPVGAGQDVKGWKTEV